MKHDDSTSTTANEAQRTVNLEGIIDVMHQLRTTGKERDVEIARACAKAIWPSIEPKDLERFDEHTVIVVPRALYDQVPAEIRPRCLIASDFIEGEGFITPSCFGLLRKRGEPWSKDDFKMKVTI